MVQFAHVFLVDRVSCERIVFEVWDALSCYVSTAAHIVSYLLRYRLESSACSVRQ
jgi:hypothetical protein